MKKISVALLLMALGAGTPRGAISLKIAKGADFFGCTPVTGISCPSDDNEAAKMVRIREALDYFKALGYNYVLYSLIAPQTTYFSRTSSGSWSYNGGNYTGEALAQSYAQMKTEIESRGMTMIPELNDLSHVPEAISLDPSISEFDAAHPKPGSCIDHVASAGPLGANPGADQIFEEYLKVIKANSGSSVPAYINIGHDELGCSSISYIKAGKTAGSSESGSQLVAEEIDARIGQIDVQFGSSIKVMLFADSFLPGDYGTTYGLAGGTDGAGGVLSILKAAPYSRASRLVLMPWFYSFLEYGDYFDEARQLHPSKVLQIQRMDALGISYVPVTGEDGDYGHPIGFDHVQTTECLYEWVKISSIFPKKLLGYAHIGFNKWDYRNPQGILADYTASALSYLAWAYSRELARPGKPWRNRVDYARSREERSWVAGTHYQAPLLDRVRRRP